MEFQNYSAFPAGPKLCSCIAAADAAMTPRPHKASSCPAAIQRLIDLYPDEDSGAVIIVVIHRGAAEPNAFCAKNRQGEEIMKFAKSPFFILMLIFVFVQPAPARAGWDEGVAAFTAKDFDQAVREFQAIVSLYPENWLGHYLLGSSLEKMGRKEESLNHLRKAYDLNPNDLSVKMAMGKAYTDNGQHKNAELIFEESLKPVWKQLGFVYEKQKKYAKSISAYRQAGDLASVRRVQQFSRRR